MKSSDKLKIIRSILIAAIILWALFIWSNSLFSAAKSNLQSAKVIEFLRPLLERLGIPKENWYLYVRKAAHFTEFFVIGLLLSAVFKGRRMLLPLFISFFIAAADEVIQLFIPGRSGEFLDVLLDTAGALLAVLIVWMSVFLIRRYRKIKEAKKQNETN